MALIPPQILVLREETPTQVSNLERMKSVSLLAEPLGLRLIQQVGLMLARLPLMAVPLLIL
jgi:hypothetical protein